MSSLRPMMLLKSKLSMPKLERDVLFRRHLYNKIGHLLDYSITVFSASAGYGKTTTLIQLVNDLKVSYGWYCPGPEDDNIYLFSSYLASAIDPYIPGFKDWYLENLSVEEPVKFDWKKAFSLFMAGMEYLASDHPQPYLLVVDDWQWVHKEPEIGAFFNRFLACKPDEMHVVLLSREAIALPEVDRLRARGQVLDISVNDLAFSLSETGQFLNSNDKTRYSKKEIQKIYHATEGWVMAIRLISSVSYDASAIAASKKFDSHYFNSLFEYLAHDVLARQTKEVQQFLLASSIFRVFSVPICQAVFGETFRPCYLEELISNSLFINEVEVGYYRYHHLFREFLQREAERRLTNLRELHAKTGHYFLQEGQEERAFMHLLQGQQWLEAVQILEKNGRDLVFRGQGRWLKKFVNMLPPAYQKNPQLYIALGDEERFSCNYYKALELYEYAERIYSSQESSEGLNKAYRGMAEIYLDIIQPAQAQVFLRKAYKTLGGADNREKAVILGLMAENMINAGKPRKAERYRRLAHQSIYFKDNNNLEARILLRTGRYLEAIRVLKRRESQKEPFHIPCSFRETPLLLSVCYTYVGDYENALITARQGRELGEKMLSPFVKAVGLFRAGHAYLISNPRDLTKSREAYNKAREIANDLGISRGFTEILQGECLLNAIEGNWEDAKNCGLDGLKLTEKVNDGWFTAIMYHTLGMAAVICKVYEEAQKYFVKSANLFKVCGDDFGQTATNWWKCYLALQMNAEPEFRQAFTSLKETLTQPSAKRIMQCTCLIGDVLGVTSKPIWDQAAKFGLLTPNNSKEKTCAGIEVVQQPLKIITLGQFKIWRGEREIQQNDWKRESSKRLFFLFLTLREAFLHKETIMTYLWPEADFEAALRYYKVALSNLMSVLEPERQPRKPSSYIAREGATYYLNRTAEFYLDADEFEQKVKQGISLLQNDSYQAERLLREAIKLYEGDYLEGITQDEWCITERERLESLYIKAAGRIAKLLISRGKYEECLQWTDEILKKDQCCERAYQLKLWCYNKLHDSAMLARTYRKCCEVLQEELGVLPSNATSIFYQKSIKEL